MEKGIAFLKSPGLRNNRLLATYCLEDTHIDDHIVALQLTDPAKRTAWKARFKSELSKELEDVKDKVKHVIISSEHFHSRLISDKEIQNLHDLLTEYFTEISILVYIRRQDLLAVSQNSTNIKTGGPGNKNAILEGKITPADPYFNYYTLTNKWGRIFGKENIQLRIFEKKKFVNNDLLQDFIIATGVLKQDWKYAIPGNKNPSLSSDALNVLKVFNAAFVSWKSNWKAKHKPPVEDLRNILIARLEQEFAGVDMMLTEEQARKFYRQFEESNRQLSEEWFDGNPLFDDDFSNYNEHHEEEIDPSKLSEVTFLAFFQYLNFLFSTKLVISSDDLDLSREYQKAEVFDKLASIFESKFPEVSRILREESRIDQ